MKDRVPCFLERTPLIETIERVMSSGQITLVDRQEFNAAVCSESLLSADERAAIREAIARLERGSLQIVD